MQGQGWVQVKGGAEARGCWAKWLLCREEGEFGGQCGAGITGGGGAEWQPGLLCLTHPPTHPPTHPHQKIFPDGKNEIYQSGPKLEVDFRYTNFFSGV